MSAATKHADARRRAKTEFAHIVAAVETRMLEDFPQGGPLTRAFLAEDFVTRWVLYGFLLPHIWSGP